VVDFLRDSRRYEAMGARLPRGILLSGPSGTGVLLGRRRSLTATSICSIVTAVCTHAHTVSLPSALFVLVLVLAMLVVAVAATAGKTLLARAVAGESRVPFISCSASDFVEMLVGRYAAHHWA
jgi:ATP-dependent Zn protease